MRFKRIIQQPWLCGPATLEMMVSFYGKSLTQNEIADATGIPYEVITGYGISLHNLAKAVHRLDNRYVLLARYNSTISDLAEVVKHVPVGVEWRCVFREPDGSIWGEGHYSIVDSVDLDAGLITLVDPFHGENISHEDGVIAVDDFSELWWDENYMPGDDGADQQVFTYGLMFILVAEDKQARFADMGFAPMAPELALAARTAPRPITLPTSPDEAVMPEEIKK